MKTPFTRIKMDHTGLELQRTEHTAARAGGNQEARRITRNIIEIKIHEVKSVKLHVISSEYKNFIFIKFKVIQISFSLPYLPHYNMLEVTLPCVT